MRSESNVLVARRGIVVVLAGWEGLLISFFSLVLDARELLVESVLLFDLLFGLMISWMEPLYSFFFLLDFSRFF